jgi:antibiotic biosynthesis monooxygenase (ABM) superfamily enzyme
MLEKEFEHRASGLKESFEKTPPPQRAKISWKLALMIVLALLGGALSAYYYLSFKV